MKDLLEALSLLQEVRDVVDAVEWMESEYDGTSYNYCAWCDASDLPESCVMLVHRETCDRQNILKRIDKFVAETRKKVNA